MADDDPTDDEREADRLIKESAPGHVGHQVMMAAIRMDNKVRRGETPDPVAVEDTTIWYDPGRQGSGIVIRDFLGREQSFEDWSAIERPDPDALRVAVWSIGGFSGYGPGKRPVETDARTRELARTLGDARSVSAELLETDLRERREASGAPSPWLPSGFAHIEACQVIEIFVSAGAGVIAQQALDAAVRWVRRTRTPVTPRHDSLVVLYGPDGSVIKHVRVRYEAGDDKS